MENLLKLKNELHEQLTAALNDGDAETLIRLDKTIKELEPRILAEEIASYNAKIEKNVNRRGEIKNEIETLYQERAKRMSVVAEAVDLYNRAQKEVAKVDFSLEMLNVELQTISVSNREMRETVDSLKERKMQEVMNNGFSK